MIKNKNELRIQYSINDEILKQYFICYRKLGKEKAKYYFENVFWYLWELKVNSKWNNKIFKSCLQVKFLKEK